MIPIVTLVYFGSLRKSDFRRLKVGQFTVRSMGWSEWERSDWEEDVANKR